MANELDKFETNEAVAAEEQVELDEFKASGENSAVAEPVTKGSNKRPADKTASFTAPKPGGADEKSGSEGKGEDLITAKGKSSPKRRADKSVSDAPAGTKVATPGQTGGAELAPGHSGGVKEDIDAIFGEDLAEDLREKATTVFEAAVNARVTEIETQYSEAFDAQLAEARSDLSESLSGKVDEYINYLSEQWMEDNKVAVESSLKVEIAESFMSGLKGLMEAHNVVLPEDASSDVFTELEQRVEELEGKLEEETSAKISIANELFEASRKNIFAEAEKGLADTQIEKLRALSEGLDYDNVEDYSKKLNTLKESYFDKGTAKTLAEDIVEDQDQVELDEEVKPLPGGMANYAAAISRTVRK